VWQHRSGRIKAVSAQKSEGEDMLPTHTNSLPSYPNAAPVTVTVISFVFVMFMMGEGWLW
jgi:hypothetical protein